MSNVIIPSFIETAEELFHSTASAVNSTAKVVTAYCESSAKTIKVTAKANAEVKIAKAIVKKHTVINSLKEKLPKNSTVDLDKELSDSMSDWK